MITYQRESVIDVMDEIKPLLEMHWRETLTTRIFRWRPTGISTSQRHRSGCTRCARTGN